MALPASIQQQLDIAESYLAQNTAPVIPASELPPNPPAEAPSLEAPQPVALSPAPAPVKAAPTEDWQHKYKTLQGVHNHHVGDLKLRLQQAEQLNTQLTSRMEALQAKPDVPADPKDTEVYGADMIDMVKRVAETMFGAAAQKLDERLSVLEQNLTGTANAVAKSETQSFLERLLALVPDYAATNVDEGFLAWLAEIDPMFGVPRQAALTAAGDARDAERVARVFLAYTGKPATVAPPHASEQLQRQVAPKTAASAQAAEQPANATFTVAQVQAFYRDVQRGAYRGREAEADAIEAKLNQALAAGLIDDRPHRAM